MREGCGFAALGCGGFMLTSLALLIGMSSILPADGRVMVWLIYAIMAGVPLLVGWLMTRRNPYYLGVTLITTAIAMGLLTISMWGSANDPALREMMGDQSFEFSPWIAFALTFGVGLIGWALWQEGQSRKDD